jgi:tetratricopeptide (TPR) repeat protein
MSTALRMDMHGRTYDQLRLEASDPRVLCEHALQARKLEPAISYYERAGALCEDQFDDSGALYFYRKAFELTEYEARQGRQTLRFRNICLRYGDLLRFNGEPVAAARVLQEALLGGPEEDPSIAPILSSLARCVVAGAPEHAESLVRRAVRAVTTAQNPQMIYRVFFDIGQIALQNRRFEQGLGSIRTGLSMLEGVRGLEDTIWRLYLQCAQCEAGMGRSDQAERTCLQMLERAQVQTSWLAQARFHEELAHLYVARREPQSASRRLQMALAALRFSGDRVSQVENELRLAALERETRVAWAESALGLAKKIGYLAGARRARELLEHA